MYYPPLADVHHSGNCREAPREKHPHKMTIKTKNRNLEKRKNEKLRYNEKPTKHKQGHDIANEDDIKRQNIKQRPPRLLKYETKNPRILKTKAIKCQDQHRQKEKNAKNEVLRK